VRFSADRQKENSWIDRNNFSTHLLRALRKQLSHPNDGCVEDVEHELGCDANYEHEHRDGNDDEFFAYGEINN
jgi:hypothetical protein